ncbi:MAG: TRAM domain-containing protein [Haloferacaceae archaeon]
MSSSQIPVESGETYTLEIEELGEEGDGVGYVESFAILVPEADLGETADVEITEVGSNFARAEVVDEEFGLE